MRTGEGSQWLGRENIALIAPQKAESMIWGATSQ